MAKTRRILTALSAAAAVVGGMSAAEASGEPTVVFHVDDHVRLTPAQRAVAEAEVTRIYHAAGIRIMWVDGSDDTRTHADGLTHLTIVVIGDPGTEQKAAAEGFDSTVVGQALRGTGRAYIFYSRMTFVATLNARDVGSVLDMVIAHEAGHLLLPENGHSMVGIMRADLNLSSRLPQEFMTAQSAAIRATLRGETQFNKDQ